MDRYKETFETWNKIASLYEEKFMDLDLYNDTYDFFSNSITKENAKILEVGCGPGNITKYLLSKRPDFDIFGTDIAPNMVELARKNNPQANFAVMDTRLIGELHTKYDGIIGGFCLPYLSQDEASKLISDSYSLLNNDGILYLSFVEGNPEDSDFKTGNGNRVYFNFHTLKELADKLADNNFVDLKVAKVKYHQDIHTIVTARKK